MSIQEAYDKGKITDKDLNLLLGDYLLSGDALRFDYGGIILFCILYVYTEIKTNSSEHNSMFAAEYL